MTPSHHIRLTRLLLAGLLAVLLAAPVQAARDLVLLLDDSGSMRQNDPDRRSVRAFAEFVLRQHEDDRVALVLFSGDARLSAPLTKVTPAQTPGLLASISDVSFQGAHTDQAIAVERALYELRFNGRPDADKAIILLTDGVLDTGSQAGDLEKAHWLRNALAQEARQKGVRVFSIAFTEAADFQLLHSVAETTGGDYFRATAGQDFGRILDRIDERLGDRVADAGPGTEAGGDASSASPERADDAPAAPADAGELTRPIGEAAGDGEAEAAAEADRPVEAARSAGPAADASGETGVDAVANLLANWRVWAAVAVLLAGLVSWLVLRRRAGRRILPAVIRRMLMRERGATRAVLYDMSDEADVKRYELGDRVTIIGRVAGQEPGRQYIVVRERTVGRRHATLEKRGEIYWVRDENSVNGTYINGKRIRGEQPLKHGDSVVVHKHKFLFVVPELIGSDKTLMEHDDLVRQAVKG